MYKSSHPIRNFSFAKLIPVVFRLNWSSQQLTKWNNTKRKHYTTLYTFSLLELAVCCIAYTHSKSKPKPCVAIRANLGHTGQYPHHHTKEDSSLSSCIVLFQSIKLWSCGRQTYCDSPSHPSSLDSLDCHHTPMPWECTAFESMQSRFPCNSFALFLYDIMLIILCYSNTCNTSTMWDANRWPNLRRQKLIQCTI